MSSFQKRTAPAVEVTAGFTAGVVSTAVSHPLELIKTRLQLNTASIPSFGYSFHLAQSIFRNEGGITGLYRGISPNLLGNASSWAIYFVFYEEVKKLIAARSVRGELSFYNYFTASAVSGFLTAGLTNPIWVIKTRMLSTAARDVNAYGSTADGIRQVYRADGVRGFYRGFVPSLFGVGHGALQFMIYEQLKKSRAPVFYGSDANTSRQGRRQLSTLDYLWTSGLSKVLAGAATYPYQVVRSRLQMHGAEAVYRSATDVLVRVWQQEGWLGLYKGLGPNLLRVVPSTCVTFVVYESTKGFLLEKG